MSLWASACLSYGPCARAGVYAPMASVRRVLNARVFIRASMVRHVGQPQRSRQAHNERDRKSTRLNSSHLVISYAVFCLKKKKIYKQSAVMQYMHKLIAMITHPTPAH